MSNLTIASVVPYVELPATAGAPAHLRESGGKTTVMLTVHSSRCAGCLEYLSGLAPLASAFDVWDARLLVLVPEPVGEARRVTAPFGKVLGDESRIVADPSSASVLIADRYGQIFEAVRAGASHELPPPRELEEWLKYIGTLCPE